MESHARAPKIVSITATSRCNLRCVMCDHGIRRVEKQDFDSSLIEQIGDFYAKADVVDLTGLGEPLLSDFFWKTLDRCPAQDGLTPVLMFNTNGTLLNDRNIDRILCANVRRMRISIDAADPAIFHDIRGTELVLIIEGAKKLVVRRNATGRRSPLIGIEMTVMQRNIKQVIPMLDLAKDIGVDFFEAWSVNEIPKESSDPWKITYYGGREYRWWHSVRRPAEFKYAEQMLSLLPRDELRKKTQKWMSHAKKIGVPSGFIMLGEGSGTDDYPHECWSNTDPVTWQENSIRCTLPWTELRTDYDGGVTACCWGPKKIGDLRKETMQQIWDGPTMGEMRSDLIAGRVPHVCKGAACQFINKRG